jgi:hypothetical protein
MDKRRDYIMMVLTLWIIGLLIFTILVFIEAALVRIANILNSKK